MISAAELFLLYSKGDGPIVPATYDEFNDIIEFLMVPEHRQAWDETAEEWCDIPWFYTVQDGRPLLFGREIMPPSQSSSSE